MSNQYHQTHVQAGSSSSSSAPTRYDGSSAPKSFDTYTDFALYISQRKCPKCNTALIQSSSQVEALFQNWLSNKAPINSQVKCRSCSSATCIACSDKEAHKTQVHKIEGANVSWCCSRGRLFIIWIMLCGFDVKYCRAKAHDAATTSSGRREAPRNPYGDRYGGQFAMKADTGVGYESGGFYDDYEDMFGRSPQAKVADSGKARAESAEKRTDQFHKLVFAFLKTLLPSPDTRVGNSSFDVAPPGALVSFLTNSKILDKAAELLRNDSLDDATKRKELYMALVGFLQVVGTQDATKQKVVYSERIVWPDTVNLLVLSFQGPGKNRSQTGSSLASGLRNLNIQSEVMLKGALGAKKEFADQQGTDMLWLCRMISDLSSHLRIRAGEAKGGLTTHGIVEVPDEQIWPTYAFGSKARMASEARKGRVRRLITEVTTLKTGLAQGIYVKHAMSRLGCMKVLIIGPQGTPYENGIFEFDLFCPLDYPHVSPEMLFKGTNGGTITVNPNLHPDGKVCLSLIGTWEGPKWLPHESTILQVLISIQAMIFCEHPLENEPGIMSRSDRANGANQFDMRICALTANFGILSWATNPPPLWKDEVKYHLQKNGNRVLQTVETWTREEQSGGGAPTTGMMMHMMSPLVRVDLATVLPDLQKALQRYGATYVPQRFTPTSRQQSPYGGGRGGSFGRGGMYDGFGGGRGRGFGGGGPGSGFGRGFY